MAELSTQDINDLPDSAFAYIEDGGTKDSSGKTVPRELRHFPIHDKAHVQNALSRAPQSPFGDKAMPAIRKAAKKMGIEVSDASRSRTLDEETWSDIGQTITRSMPMEDMQLRSGKVTCDTCHRDATGRMVDAYFVPFNKQAEIRDVHGHYNEEYDPASFNRRLEHLQRSRIGLFDVGVYYNHAQTIHGTPSELASVPIGHPSAIRADGRGMLGSTHYAADEFAERIRSNVVDGNIGGHSFTGRIHRSDPERVPRRVRDGSLPRVRRLEMGLIEYGPTPVPSFEDTPMVAARSRELDEPLELSTPATVPLLTYDEVRTRAARRAALVRHMLDNRC